MKTERDTGKETSGTKELLLVRFPEEECGDRLRPLSTTDIGSTDVLEAIDEKANEIEAKINSMTSRSQEAVTRRKRGRTRSAREKRDIRRQYRSEEEALKAQLRILQGKELGEINLKRRQEIMEVIGINSLEHDEMDWWQRVAGDEELLEMAGQDFKDFSRVQKGFMIRKRIKRGETDSKEFSDLVNEVGFENERVLDYLAKFTQEMN